jgi:basic membrane protein A
MTMLDCRRLLLSSAAGLAAATAPGILVPRRAAAADLVVGFIYVGPKDDYGYEGFT